MDRSELCFGLYTSICGCVLNLMYYQRWLDFRMFCTTCILVLPDMYDLKQCWKNLQKSQRGFIFFVMLILCVAWFYLSKQRD